MSKKVTGNAPVFDFKKEYKYLFSARAGKPEIVEVPPFKYLMVDGQGDPGTSKEFEEKIGLLYGLAYTIKFMMKKDKNEPFQFKVPPFSGLWYADDMNVFTELNRRNEWQWTLMILMPDQVTQEIFEKGKSELNKKKNPLHLNDVRFEVYEEGTCAQILHLGPYSEEGPTIKMLHQFLHDQGYTFNGHHHEIYIGDPRKAKPEKLKTIIRQSVRRRSKSGRDE